MKPIWLARLAGAAVAFVLVALPASVHAQSFGFPWWRDAQFQKELSLTAEQSGRIDALYQKSVPHLREKRTELDAQEEELSKMIAANSDEAVVIKQVDRVESIRAHLNKSRTLMLLRMRQILSPEQRVKLNQLYVQWEKDHRRERGK